MNGKQIARAMFDALGGIVLVEDDGLDNARIRYADGTTLIVWQDGTWFHTRLYPADGHFVNLPTARDWHEFTTVVKTALTVRSI